MGQREPALPCPHACTAAASPTRPRCSMCPAGSSRWPPPSLPCMAQNLRGRRAASPRAAVSSPLQGTGHWCSVILSLAQTHLAAGPPPLSPTFPARQAHGRAATKLVAQSQKPIWFQISPTLFMKTLRIISNKRSSAVDLSSPLTSRRCGCTCGGQFRNNLSLPALPRCSECPSHSGTQVLGMRELRAAASSGGEQAVPASPVACQGAVRWPVPWLQGARCYRPLWQAGKFSGMECSPDTRRGEQCGQAGCGARS